MASLTRGKARRYHAEKCPVSGHSAVVTPAPAAPSPPRDPIASAVRPTLTYATAQILRVLPREDAEAWRQAVQRLERRCERTNAINRVLNAQVLGWFARASAIEHTARRLLAAWRTQRQYRYALADALQGLLDEPYGCPLCDCGRTRNPAKGHMDDCPYETARAVLAELREGTR